MADLRHYRTFYGIKSSDCTQSWGGREYDYILLESYLDDEVSSDATSLSATGTTACTFLYPFRIQRNYFIEGVMHGHFHIYNWSSANLPNFSGGTSMTTFTIKLRKIDASGVSKTLEEYEKEVNRSVATTDYKCFPYWIDITNKHELKENERFAISFELESDASESLALAHDNDSSNEDFKVAIGMVL